jgi:hypothetical protein
MLVVEESISVGMVCMCMGVCGWVVDAIKAFKSRSKF